jgi:hypothetical protein
MYVFTEFVCVVCGVWCVVCGVCVCVGTRSAVDFCNILFVFVISHNHFRDSGWAEGLCHLRSIGGYGSVSFWEIRRQKRSVVMGSKQSFLCCCCCCCCGRRAEGC